MVQYFIEPRKRKYVKGYGFLSLQEIYQINIRNSY